MKLPWVKLSAFLLLGVGAAIYLWWRLSDEQAVLRQTDALFETASVQRLALGDPDKPLQIFRAIIADPFILKGSDPIPSGTYSEAEAVALLKDFRDNVGGSRIRRLETAVAFPSPDEARVETLLEVDLSWGRGPHSVDKFKAELLFQRTTEGWILTRAAFLHRPGK